MTTTITPQHFAPVAPVNPTDVYVDGEKLYGVKVWAYRVWVDGSVYDEFTSSRPLTSRDMMDVVAGYRDGLTVATAA